MISGQAPQGQVPPSARPSAVNPWNQLIHVGGRIAVGWPLSQFVEKLLQFAHARDDDADGKYVQISQEAEVI